jgi:hypothetical protein
VGNQKKNNWDEQWRGLAEIEKDVHGTALVRKKRKENGGLVRHEKEAHGRGRTHLPVKERKRPTSHIRIVRTGMSGSSMFETEARTSGYGLSSSWTVSKSNFILRTSQ